MRKLLIVVCAVFLFLGCEDVIDVDLNTSKPRLVIDARLELLEDGSSRNTILLTRSSGFFEEVNPLVEDAQVFVVDGNGVNYTFLFNGNTERYENTTLEIENSLEYTITIIDQNQTYQATQKLATTVPLQDVEQKEVAGLDGFTQIVAYFQDPAALGDNYLIQYTDLNNFELSISDDEFINGNRTPTSFFIEDLEPGTTISLEIAGIDGQAFRFFETLIQQTDAGGGGPFDTQPATVRGNVININDRDQFPFGYFRVSQVFTVSYVSE
ncbi:DUF4249 domain-containing protein [Nonlabens antarcticus]|uniref:DUF4249 domain-containing protein n=1 Tax=Nonlabens antarcticus TaxID=392714 RepID=UPI001890BB9F|nr:DUF4249 domain-containing protein [Nonlabens antarcticus]